MASGRSRNAMEYRDEDRYTYPTWMSVSGEPLDLDLPRGLLGKCRDVKAFRKLARVGEGAYGVVYRAEDTKTSDIVALKKMRLSSLDRSHGLPITLLREISLLRTLRHPNIVRMMDIAVGRDIADTYIVLEYCEQDMAYIIDELKHPFTFTEVKCLMKQMLEGLEYIHSKGMMHRDLKISNLLYQKGTLKIADFGMARNYSDRPLTPAVVTIWYRPPELLLGCTRYTKTIDLWSAGLILAEFILLMPVLPGETEIAQIQKIVDMLGPPDDSSWPKARLLPDFKKMNLMCKPHKKHSIEHRLQGQSLETIRMIKDLLMWDPEKRLSAKKALGHQYFLEEPRAKAVRNMPGFPARLEEEIVRGRSRSWGSRSRSRSRSRSLSRGRRGGGRQDGEGGWIGHRGSTSGNTNDTGGMVFDFEDVGYTEPLGGGGVKRKRA